MGVLNHQVGAQVIAATGNEFTQLRGLCSNMGMRHSAPWKPLRKVIISDTRGSGSGCGATYRPAMMPQFPGFQQPWEQPVGCSFYRRLRMVPNWALGPCEKTVGALAHSAALYRLKWEGSHGRLFLAAPLEQLLSTLAAPAHLQP